MSVEAIGWALTRRVDRSSAKFVLVAMANCAGHDMTCWPSIRYLTEATSQDRKTVIENIHRLVDAGYIEATEGRSGRTNQVVVYRLIADSEGRQKRSSSENGTVPKTDAKSPVFPQEGFRFSAETVPKTGHGTVKEPSIEPSGRKEGACAPAPAPAAEPVPWDEPSAPAVQPLASVPIPLPAPPPVVPHQKPPAPAGKARAIGCPEGVDAQVWADWLGLRAKKKAPVTATVLDGAIREARKAGMGLEDFLRIWCLRGSQGLQASWLSNDERGGARAAQAPPPAAGSWQEGKDKQRALAAEIYRRAGWTTDPATGATVINFPEVLSAEDDNQFARIAGG